MIKYVVSVLLMFMAVPAFAQESGGTVSSEQFESATLGRVYHYNVYLPAGYENEKRQFPVIYLLHGRSDSMDSWLNVTDALDTLIDHGNIQPIIAVMPDMPSSNRAGYYIDSQYTGNDYPAEAIESAFFNDLIPHVDSTYRTLDYREGRLIGGYSMGGFGATRYALAYPDMFAGALILSPATYTPLPPEGTNLREFGAFGKGTEHFDKEVYTSHNYPALLDSFADTGYNLGVFIAVGDDESHDTPIEEGMSDLDMVAHVLYNQVVRIPTIEAEFRVYDGGHHWDTWRPGFIEGIQYLSDFIDGGE